MIPDLFSQLASELLRALLIDELSEHVRRKVLHRLGRRRALRRQRFYLDLNRRRSQRLLHKLRTGTQ
jgi:hypothetical protein